MWIKSRAMNTFWRHSSSHPALTSDWGNGILYLYYEDRIICGLTMHLNLILSGLINSLFSAGAQTRFTFELPNHKLCFQSKVSPVDTMSAMPPSANLNLPPVTMSGEYIMEDHEGHSDFTDDFPIPMKQGNYLQGNYLRCVAEVRLPYSSRVAPLLQTIPFINIKYMSTQFCSILIVCSFVWILFELDIYIGFPRNAHAWWICGCEYSVRSTWRRYLWIETLSIKW